MQLLKTTFTQQITEANEKILTAQTNLNSIDATIGSLDKQIKILEKHIQQSQENIQSTSSNVYDYFQQTKEDLAKKLTEFSLLSNNCTRLTDQALKKVGDLSQKTNDNFQLLEKFRLMIKDQNMQMAQLFHEKSNSDDFIKFTSTIEARLDASAEKFRLLDNKHKEIVRYIDLYLPFDIQVYISDNLYSFLNKKLIKV